jgi:broad specificity phosphatase PhoE
MPTTYIHLVRHAQGYHNLSKENETIHDPDLTPLGEEQCAKLRKDFPYHDKVTHLVASPMRRTLRTCLLGFAAEVEAGMKIVALPEVQELSPLPCDVGSDPAVLAKDFDSSKVDLRLVKDGWNDKTTGSPWEPTIPRLDARAEKARVWLRDLGAQSTGDEDVHIVVVSHGGFIHFFTEDWDGMNPSRGACMSPSLRDRSTSNPL